MIAAKGTGQARVNHFHLSIICTVNIRGMSPFTVNVITSVVINILSAAGSKIVPRTDCIWSLRAKYPSAYRPQSVISRNKGYGKVDEAHQIRNTSIGQYPSREVEVIM